MSHEGRGIAHQEGRVIFVDGALIGEKVKILIFKQSRKFAEARVLEVLLASPDRIPAKCAVFGLCGGCSLQHLPSEKQIQFKQEMLSEQFQHFGGSKPKEWLNPLQNKVYGYRSKARLGVRYLPKKNQLLLGFREKSGKCLIQMSRCEVLDPVIGENLELLKAWISSLSIYDQIPQLEVAIDDKSVVLIVRHMVNFSEADLQKIREFVDEFSAKIAQSFQKNTENTENTQILEITAKQLVIYLQPKGPESIKRFYPEGPELLSYEISEFDLKFLFGPTDFTQVNMSMNGMMIQQALNFLDLKDSDIVLDLFCGLGNFTLPLAKFSQHVVGVEGDAAMTARALINAENNSLKNIEFYAENLFEPFAEKAFFKSKKYDKVLLDPPRSGALQACTEFAALAKKDRKKAPQKIVYVSCNPSTLARDTGVLVDAGYVLTHAGVMDMFPHTEHVESMAVFSFS
jgi:23S rRNA (uracil1939-C5)-methyltransferase